MSDARYAMTRLADLARKDLANASCSAFDMVASSLRTDWGRDSAISAGMARSSESSTSGLGSWSMAFTVRRSRSSLVVVRDAPFYMVLIKDTLALCFLLDFRRRIGSHRLRPTRRKP